MSPAAGHHHVRLRAFVVARLPPDADALGAMRNGFVHGHVLQVLLLVGHNDVDVARALKAVIGHTQQTYLRLAAGRSGKHPGSC